MRVDVVLHLAAEVRGLDVGVAEVDPRPDTCLKDLVGQVREAMENTLLAWESAARGVERHLVPAEERLQRVHAGTRVRRRTRDVVRIRRCDQRRTDLAG